MKNRIISLGAVVGFLVLVWLALRMGMPTNSTAPLGISPGQPGQLASAPATVSSPRLLPSSAQGSLAAGSTALHVSTNKGSSPGINSVEIWARLNAFDSWMRRYQVETNAGLRLAMIPEGEQRATERRVAMYHLIKTDPQRAIKATVTAEMRSLLPDQVAQNLEERISARGDLTVIFASPQSETGTPEIDPVNRLVTIQGTLYYAYTFGRRLKQLKAVDTPIIGVAVGDRLAWSDQPYRLLDPFEVREALADRAQSLECSVCGEPLHASTSAGLDLGGKIAFLCRPEEVSAYFVTPEGQEIWAGGGAGGTGTNSLVNPPTDTQGNKKFLFMRVRFADDAANYEPETDAQVRSDLNNTMARYAAMSYGTFQGSYAYTPTLTLPKPRSGYMNGWSSTDGMTALLNDAKTAAGAYVETNGTRPYQPANFDIFAARWNGEPGGNYSFGGGGNAWIRWNGYEVLVHEWGHAIGVTHARSWNPTTDDPIGDGVAEEYGNVYDSMGNADVGSGARDYSAMFKARLNWLGPTNVHTVTSNGTYRIFVHDQPTLIPANRYAVRIHRTTRYDYDYWLEYRNNTVTGADGFYWTNGVGVLRDWQDDLLDMTPGSAKGKTDCTLTLGRTYNDSTAGIHITPIRRGTSGQPYIDVTVNLDDGANNHPPVAAITASASIVGVGASVTFAVTALDPDGDALAYTWDFGDGTVSYNNSATQTKAWSNGGSYVVRCVVSDMRGQIAGVSATVAVGTFGSYLVRGRALDAAGVPLVNVQIRDGAGRLAFTDSDGRYALGLATNGLYLLKAYQGGSQLSPSFMNPMRVAAGAWGADFMLNTSRGPGLGLWRDYWTNLAGSTVANLTSSPRYPNQPNGVQKVADAFEGPEDWAENFGARYRGYFVAPQSGGYTFYIASDDSSELWLSRDTNPAAKTRIAYLNGYTDSRKWDAQATQKSALLQLVAGQRYYLEALHKEGGGSDHLSAGVDLPDGTQERPIPFHRLESLDTPPTPVTMVDVVATDAVAAEPDDPGVFTLTRTGDTNTSLAVFYRLSGTAVYGVDYQPTGLQATIPAGQYRTTVVISPKDDSLGETVETVYLALVPGTNYSVSPAAEATINLYDKAGIIPTVTLIAKDPTATKSTGDPAEITLYRTGGVESNLLVNLGISGTAIKDVDYVAISNSVVIPAGAASIAIQLQPLRNSNPEQMQTIIIILASGQGYYSGSPSMATILLEEPGQGPGLLREWWTNIDGSNVADLTNNASYPNTPSGSGFLTDWLETPRDWQDSYGQRIRGLFIAPMTGTYRFVIASDDASELWISTNTSPQYKTRVGYVNGWVSPRDWSAQANQRSNPIRLAAGQRYYVEALHKEGGGSDHLAVGVEMPNNVLERPVAATRFEPWTSQGTLLYVTATQPKASKNGEPGVFTLRRTGSNASALTANLALSGTARNGVDYVTLSNRVQFTAGSSQVAIPVVPIPNGLSEAPKTVVLTVQTGSGYGRGFSDSATVMIGSDPPLASLVLSIPDASESGPTAGLAVVTLNTAPFSTLPVFYQTSGSAVSGSDYVALPGVVTIAAGQRQALISVMPIDDNLPEPRENIVLTLVPGTGYLVSSASNVAITILDNDSPYATNLIQADSLWKYHDQGQDLGNDWRTTNYMDDNWLAGNAPLGYSSGSDFQPATTISLGADPANKPVTTYFRQSFTVTDPSLWSSLLLSARYDDGVVVYLNDTEIFRGHLPDGPVDFKVLALSEMDAAEKMSWHLTHVSSTWLQPGLNVLAAEVHLAQTNSPDLWFELELAAQTGTASPSLILNRQAVGYVLRWPVSAGSFQLQSTTDLISPPAWQPVLDGISTTNEEYRFDSSTFEGQNRFFRLIKE